VSDFLCPNGHRIHCLADQAGRAAKCPRCGVRFRIPTQEGVPAEAAPGADSDISPPELSDSGASSASAVRPRPSQKEPQIEFLCPNGHHLHGPASLQGRPGACPECGSRFRIPILDESDEQEEEQEAAPEQLDLGSLIGEEQGGSGAAQAAEDIESDQAPAILDEASTSGQDDVPSALEMPSGAHYPPVSVEEAASNTQIVLRDRQSAVSSAGPAPGHPLAQVVAQLWAAKGTAKLELQLAGGETLVPDYFAKRLSHGNHGAFATKASDGCWTLTVIRWDAVERVLLRDLKSLPAEWAE